MTGDLNLSRRNFLKGFMATAGIVAVGVPIAVVEAMAAPEPVLPSVVEFGDLWIRSGEVQRFIGKTLSISVYQTADVIDFRSFDDDFPARKLLSSGVELEARLIVDEDGMGALRSFFDDAKYVDCVTGHQYGEVIIPQTFIRDISTTFYHHRGCREVEFKAVGAPARMRSRG